MPRVLLAVPAVLAQLEALGRFLPVLRRAVVPALTLQTRKRNDVSHNNSNYARISVIVPIAMEEKLRFAIREGGRTVGAGVVASIIE